MIHSSRGNVFLGVYCSLQQLCMWRFSFYHMCNCRKEHSTVLRDEGLVQNFGSTFKLNWIFCKVLNPLTFFHALCSWYFFHLFPIHWVHADSCQLAAFQFVILGTIIISYYNKTMLLYNAVSGNKKIELASKYWITARHCAFPLKQANQSKKTNKHNC